MFSDFMSYPENFACISIRAPKSPYVTKRSNLMLKMKIIDDAEAIVVDYIDGTSVYLFEHRASVNNHKFL